MYVLLVWWRYDARHVPVNIVLKGYVTRYTLNVLWLTGNLIIRWQTRSVCDNTRMLGNVIRLESGVKSNLWFKFRNIQRVVERPYCMPAVKRWHRYCNQVCLIKHQHLRITNLPMRSRSVYSGDTKSTIIAVTTMRPAIIPCIINHGKINRLFCWNKTTFNFFIKYYKRIIQKLPRQNWRYI